MRVACIGSRGLTEDQLESCRRFGQWIAKMGHELHTGNALGADQAFAYGANQVDPTKVFLHLPWQNYEKSAITEGNQVFVVGDITPELEILYERLARQAHPAWARLESAARKLHIRNSSIICPPPKGKPVDLVLAWPREGASMGGTGQGIRVAQQLGIQWVALNKTNQKGFRDLAEFLRVQRVA